MPTELPHNFQRAVEPVSRSFSHAFCRAPSMLPGEASRRGLGRSCPPKRIVSGAPPGMARPASRASTASWAAYQGKPRTTKGAASARSAAACERKERLSLRISSTLAPQRRARLISRLLIAA